MSLDLTKPLFVAGTTASAFLSGTIMGISLVPIPALLDTASLPEAQRLHLWRSMFARGKALAPPLAALAALASLGNAWAHYRPAAPARALTFAGAGALALAIVPFTLLVMAPTNAVLLRRAERGAAAGAGGAEAVTGTGSLGFGLDDDKRDGAVDAAASVGDGEEGESTDALIARWRALNIVRALLPLAGALLAFEAI